VVDFQCCVKAINGIDSDMAFSTGVAAIVSSTKSQKECYPK
jgi:hypothetical protein